MSLTECPHLNSISSTFLLLSTPISECQTTPLPLSPHPPCAKVYRDGAARSSGDDGGGGRFKAEIPLSIVRLMRVELFSVRGRQTDDGKEVRNSPWKMAHERNTLGRTHSRYHDESDDDDAETRYENPRGHDLRRTRKSEARAGDKDPLSPDPSSVGLRRRADGGWA